MLLVGVAVAASLTFDETRIVDSWLDAFDDSPHGDDGELWATTLAGVETAVFLLGVEDLVGPTTDQLPLGATISAAELQLYAGGGSLDGDLGVSVSPLREAWTEAGATWTWADQDGGRAWAGAGATDRKSVV